MKASPNVPGRGVCPYGYSSGVPDDTIQAGTVSTTFDSYISSVFTTPGKSSTKLFAATTTPRPSTNTVKPATTIKPIKHPTPPYINTPQTTINVFNNNITFNTQQQQPRKFYINTSRCHMPYVDPFTPQILKMFKPSHTTGCTKDEPIVTVHFDDTNEVYRLQTNYSVAQQFIKHATSETIVDDLRCCYRHIERSGSGASADSKFNLLPCVIFHQNFTVPTHINAIIVDCSSKSLKKVIQQDAFTFIQVKDAKKPVSAKNHTDANIPQQSEVEKLGILLIGIDSLSRINFRRTMPHTYAYLKEKGWYELKGYNKVADNTYPNLMPILAGFTDPHATQYCKPTTVGGLDNCPFVWKRFHDHGFVTGFAEDTVSISTFNYKKKGFLKPPTDHYFRPAALAIEKTMQKRQKAGLYYCVGRRQYGEYVYDYGVEFAKRYLNRKNFGLFWTNSFSHNAYDTSATMDDRMRQYLEELEGNGILETSVVFFFSDHGRRWGPLLKLPEGFLEERLPMFFISTPNWFKSRYPELSRNLELNQKRLSAPYDIYLTLQQLLQLATLGEYKPQQASDCPTAYSLFDVIPEDRDCDSACVPESWCTCLPYVTQSTKSPMVGKIAAMVVEKMNDWLWARNLSSLCSELGVQSISNALMRDHDPAMLSSATASPDIETYRIDFTTKPKTSPVTEFSATLDYDKRTKSINLNVEDIARHSIYEKTAKCVDDKQAKKYCICKNAVR
ncbi:uncharacterized protein LOC133321637 [Musca vetustissima]|uniref:uncharacterized protein LOC133321637 n=1 Tax=Musca vetustissima TaxID=27455 RepID=UPI002AB774EC|nr:uncharacterized protein LOC133321637 [Musca vetustissima]